MPVRRPSIPRRKAAALVVSACACLGARPAHAAADDINAPRPAGAPAASNPVVALGKRVIDGVIATGAGVVDAIGASVAVAAATSPGKAPGGNEAWRLGSAVRPSTLAARAAAGADAAADPSIQARPAGLADFSLGARWRVLQGDPASNVPVVSWMADVQPANAAALAGGGVLRPSMHLSAEWALAGEWTLGLMPGIAMDLDNQGRRYAGGTLAVTLGREWMPGVHAFVDLARDRVPLDQGGGNATTMDAGLTIMTGPATQLDLAFARGLTAAAPPFQAGLGLSSSF